MEFSEMSKQQQIENADHTLHLSNVDIQSVHSASIPSKHQRKRRVTYKCKVCYKAFRTLSVCQAHTNLHSKSLKTSEHGLRIFHCRICNSNHRGLTAFLEHQNLHDQLKPFSQQQQYIYTTTDVHQNNEQLISNQQNNEQLISGQNGGGGVEPPTAEEVIVTTTDGRNMQLTDEAQQQNQQGGSFKYNNAQTILSNPVGLTAEQLSNISLPASIMAVLCNAVTPVTNTAPNQTAVSSSMTGVSGGGGGNIQCKTATSDNGIHVNIPSHVKSIHLNSSNPSLMELSKQLDSLNRKVDIIMKHLTIPLDDDDSYSLTMATQDAMDVDRQTKPQMSTDEESATIMIENFPPSYSVVQAAKEQQQQEFYALQISSRQQQQTFKQQQQNEHTHLISNTSSKPKSVENWLPSQQYIAQINSLTDQHEEEDESLVVEIENPQIPQHIIDKVFVESRSRANFAKNLTFAIFTVEERRGKNCSGRVFGKAQHKGQLDQIKLNAVKDATFRKYPSRADLIDMTWRKECITAIDSGLRNEHRSNTKPTSANTSII